MIQRYTQFWFFRKGSGNSVCVCVYVCVCLYSSAVKASPDCKISETYFRVMDQRCYVVISFQVLLLSSFISVSDNVTFHFQRQNSSTPTNWRETIWYMIRVTKRLYILIWDIGQLRTKADEFVLVERSYVAPTTLLFDALGETYWLDKPPHHVKVSFIEGEVASVFHVYMGHFELKMLLWTFALFHQNYSV